jgi:hypothetical protein
VREEVKAFLNGKQFTVAALLTLVFLTLASTPLSSQQAGTFDPWLDYNEDGKIDISDLQPLSQDYGTSGDTTKNVTVVRHETKLIIVAVNVSVPPRGEWTSGLIWIDGYSKVTALILQVPLVNCRMNLTAWDYTGSISWRVEYLSNPDYSWTKTYEVMNQQLSIDFISDDSTHAVTLYIDIYLVA